MFYHGLTALFSFFVIPIFALHAIGFFFFLHFSNCCNLSPIALVIRSLMLFDSIFLYYVIHLESQVENLEINDKI